MARRLAVLVTAVLLLLCSLTAATESTEASQASRSAQDAVVSGDRHRDSLSVSPLVGRADRPDVLVIMTDDARDDDLRYLPHVRHLIGDKGVRFSNAFSPQPLCCPARASFLTGQYSHNHHVWSQAPPYGFRAFRDRSTLPVWLQDAGYDTAFLGKYLNGYGVQRLRNGLPSLRYVPPGWTDWRGAVDGGVAAGPGLDGGTYRYFDTTLNENGRLTPHQGIYQTTLLGRLTRQMVRERLASPRPSFTWLSFVAPHHGSPAEPDDPRPVRRADGTTQVFRNPARPARVRGRFDGEIRHAPGLRGEADVRDKPFFVRGMPPLTAAEQAGVLEDARQRAEALSLVDLQVARTVRLLRRSGRLDNTYVVFTSDNGYFLGEHRMRQGKILPYDPSLRVPLLIRGPGIPAGEVRTDPFTTIDLAPTILAATGVRAPRSVDGDSLLEVARHGDRGWDRGILTETGPRAVSSDAAESDNFLVRSGGPSPLRFSQGVRTARYLYVEHASRERELYDLRADPRQLTNLASRPAERRVVRRLAHQLDRLRNCAGAGCRAPLPASLRDRPGP